MYHDGSESDPHRNIQPVLMDPNAAWKQQDGVDFLPELNEIRMRIQVCGYRVLGKRLYGCVWVWGFRLWALSVGFVASARRRRLPRRTRATKLYDLIPPLTRPQQGVNVYLVGMMGSGKTTVGRMLAEGLGAYRWMDLDQFIEGKLGKTAAQVRRAWEPCWC